MPGEILSIKFLQNMKGFFMLSYYEIEQKLIPEILDAIDSLSTRLDNPQVREEIITSRMFPGPYSVAHDEYLKGDPFGGFQDEQSLHGGLFAIDTHLESISDFVGKMRRECPILEQK
jgi:hypothetical protein